MALSAGDITGSEIMAVLKNFLLLYNKFPLKVFVIHWIPDYIFLKNRNQMCY